MRALLITVSASLLVPISALGALSAVFEYSFPDSYSGEGPLLVDQSSAANNGTIDGAGSGGYQANVRPPGFTTGGSLTGASGGHGETDAIDLLQNSTIDAFGGFTMDVWFRWEGNYSDVRKLIDYAGTEYLRTNNGKIEFGLSNATTILSEDIVAQQWHHAVAEFDSGSNVTDGGGSLDGTMRLWLDGTKVGETNATKTNFGDSLNRPIGINRWGGGSGDHNQGSIYQPSVYYGVVPEPGWLALLCLALVSLLQRRR